AVVHGDGVELAPDAAGGRHRVGDQAAEVLEVDVPRYELGVAVGDGDDRLAEVVVRHAGRTPEGAGAGHGPAVGGGPGAQLRHGPILPPRPDRTERPAEGRGR